MSELNKRTNRVLGERLSLTSRRNPLVNAAQEALRGMGLTAPEVIDAATESPVPAKTTLEEVRSANASIILARAVEQAG